ncbi:hypothetical protein TrVE_jg14105 [Triparma verrucosa]|uniref:Uncharacterized protein n=1 Tax=Triparma verrucosa TaxID=1606542 RepID=A0A9W7BQ72_9STRA|nr:hypothetical protein TrVE_jg14105 [Triparma verrucosa]
MKSQSSLVLALALLLPRSNSYYVSPLSVSRLPHRVGLPHAPFTSVRVPSVRHALPETTEEADDVLSKNGWGGLFAPEEPENEELMSDSPFVLAIDEEISELNSISDGLAGLLNPAKCVNLEQQIVGLKMDIMELTKEAVEEDWLVVRSMSEEEYDDPAVSTEELVALREKLEAANKKLYIEKRTVFRGWLKDIFLVQAILSFVLSGVMVFSPETLFGGFGWYNDPKLNMEISIEVLGFWWWWLFIIPSLRSRRPQGLEKQALDYAFLTTPLASLVMPVITRNCGVIWGVDFAVVLACYAVAFGGGGGGEIKKEGLAGWIFKSLDFGSGKERGLRK